MTSPQAWPKADLLQQLQAEIDALHPVEKRVGDAEARLRVMRLRRSTLDQQTQSIAEQLVAVRSGSALLEQLRQVTPQGVRLCLLYTSPSPRDLSTSRMPSSA